MDHRPVILLVEDSPQDAYLTRIAFERAGTPHSLNVALHVARDGADALGFLRRDASHDGAPRPDLILLDLNMPGVDGRTVLREVKSDPNLRRIPIIVLTTSSAPEDVALTYDLYANAYLTKPIGLEEWAHLVDGIRRFWLELNQPAPG
jgi:two-component system response regulator